MRSSKKRLLVHEADILIIDPLISFHNLDENSNDQMRKLLDQVSLLAKKSMFPRCSSIIMGRWQRTVEQEGAEGASAIGDWSPNTWELKFNKNTKQYSIHHNKARNFMLQEPLTLELDHLRFKKVGSVAQTTNVQYVITALQGLGGIASSKKALKDKVMEIYSSKNKGKLLLIQQQLLISNRRLLSAI